MVLEFVIVIYHAEVVVGLEETFYQVSEDVSVVEVCAVVYEPDSSVPCPISFPFTISLFTSDTTAGRYVMYCCYSIFNAAY